MNRNYIIAMILFLAVIITSSCTGNKAESYEEVEELTNKNIDLLDENNDLIEFILKSRIMDRDRRILL